MELTFRQFDYWATVYQRTWKGTVVSSFLMPFLYLVAMGVGLGSFIDEGAGGMSYLQFVATGMLAATAMQTALFESTYPVMGGIKWHRTFYAMIATPLRAADVVYGQLGYILFRIGTTCLVFLLVAAGLGGIPSWLAVLTVPVTLLVGLAYAAPVVALTTRMTDESGFALVFRFGMLPMFLFSGAFFPVSQLPAVVEWLAYLTPLWHGVELCRGFGVGAIGLPAVLGHTAYLLVWAGVGTWLSVTGMTRRLVK